MFSRLVPLTPENHSAYSLEVPQADGFPLWVSIANVLEHELAHHFCSSIDALRRHGCALRDGYLLGDSVHGSTGGVDHAGAVVLLHCLKEVDCAEDVDIVVAAEGWVENQSACSVARVQSCDSLDRNLSTLSDSLERSDEDDGPNLVFTLVLVKDGLDRSLVP